MSKIIHIQFLVNERPESLTAWQRARVLRFKARAARTTTQSTVAAKPAKHVTVADLAAKFNVRV